MEWNGGGEGKEISTEVFGTQTRKERKRIPNPLRRGEQEGVDEYLIHE